ncbi:AprI/Inh family metalloprotease inhibitor [Pelagibacterium limicola]|uniref:AprI/Inh family metalloprotease inhibitor n=1 Tax=Pelagibacterium limicola TaxID=2791022 RepID=UPI0018AF8486|nr:AprI/Inh family metalloprotease inhibitor [Pelagibacterium limicola]
MTRSITRMGLLGAGVALAAVIAGCSPTTGSRPAPLPQPQASAPVATSTVQTADLPPIGGQPAAASPTTGTTGAYPANTTGLYDPLNQTASTDGFVSLDGMGAPGNTMGGRDLSGALTMEKLLGGWTIISGAEQCRLNLTYTAKGATGRYRASTPACNQPVLATVTSWQLLGNQIQLYNEADEIVGTLLKSGDRFVGTLAGGQAVSMVG